MFGGNTKLIQSQDQTTTIAPGSLLRDCDILDSSIDGTIIEGGHHTKISRSHVAAGTVFFGGAKIRDSQIGSTNEIGAIEIVRSQTGNNLKALHR
jgi:NDP-sugar pyrophosphorylase family protein